MPHGGWQRRAQVQRWVEIGEPVSAGLLSAGRGVDNQRRDEAGRADAQRPVRIVEGGNHLVGRGGRGERVLRSRGHRPVLQQSGSYNQLVGPDRFSADQNYGSRCPTYSRSLGDSHGGRKKNTENNQRRGSGSVCFWALWIGIRIRYQRYGSEDPDPHPDPYQNVTEPQHWFPRRSATVGRLQPVFRIRIRSGQWIRIRIRIRMGQNDPQKWRKFKFWSAGCSLIREWGLLL